VDPFPSGSKLLVHDFLNVLPGIRNILMANPEMARTSRNMVSNNVVITGLSMVAIQFLYQLFLFYQQAVFSVTT